MPSGSRRIKISVRYRDSVFQSRWYFSTSPNACLDGIIHALTSIRTRGKLPLFVKVPLADPAFLRSCTHDFEKWSVS